MPALSNDPGNSAEVCRETNTSENADILGPLQLSMVPPADFHLITGL